MVDYVNLSDLSSAIIDVGTSNKCEFSVLVGAVGYGKSVSETIDQFKFVKFWFMSCPFICIAVLLDRTLVWISRGSGFIDWHLNLISSV